MKLKFKNVGWFSEEDSARYEANVNEYLFVRVTKCVYMNGFKFSFHTHEGYDIDDQGDLIANFWNGATKKEAVTAVYLILKESVNSITENAKQITERMKPYSHLNKRIN